MAGVVARKGAAVTFTSTTAGVYDPLTGVTAGATTATVSGNAMQIDGEADVYKDLGLLESENPTLLFVPSTLGELPEMGASVPWGGDTFVVKNRRRLAMNGTPSAAFVVVGR